MRNCADPHPPIALVPARTGHYTPDVDPLFDHYTRVVPDWRVVELSIL
jgi:hypothetical protein